MERVAAFVDGSYLYNSLKEISGRSKVRMWPLIEKLCPTGNIVGLNYYSVALDPTTNPESYAGQRRFFAYIEGRSGGKVRLGKMYRRNNIWVEKGVDVLLAVDLVLGAVRDEYDTAIVITGDGDLAGAVEAARLMGKTVVVVGLRRSFSYNLRRVADRYVVPDREFFEGLWLDE